MELTGLIGWRGMVGSVLLERMQAEGDFDLIEPLFFSTSDKGGVAPAQARNETRLHDAYDIEALKRCRILVSAQGGDYTKDVYPRLRAAGWNGFWIDAAKTLRMQDDAVIVLDPVNLGVIRDALKRGVRNYIGGNCTVSCMLMGVGALFKADLVEWMTCTTYQAASGGGAQHMRELLTQYGTLNAEVRALLDDPKSAILEIDRKVLARQHAMSAAETANFGVPLGGSLIPRIDADRGDGTSLEEWKGAAETNKILGRGFAGGAAPVPIDSICVRIGAMRCHSQSLTIRLKRDVPLADIEAMIAADNEWVRVVPNTRADSVRDLTPVAVTGTMKIPVGRLRKLAIGDRYLGAFTVGDQLLWGAAEPLRRMLRILLEA
ncbi:MAG: aspartate-semialdehyde dehydrogenase [Caldimonas sp.]